jgi:ankyrin repeat protein
MLAIAQRREEPIRLPTLMDAVEAGNLQVVHELLNGRADVNAATSNGMTALMCAAKNGHLKTLLLLLEAGADVNYVRNDGMTALALAAFFGHLQLVEELINRGAVLDVPGSRNPPEAWAASRGFLDIAYFLKKARARTPHIREVHSSQSDTLLSEAKPQAVETLDSECTEQIDVTGSASSQLHSIDQPEWLEFSEAAEVSAASVWASDYEEEIPNQNRPEAGSLEYFEADDRLDGIGTVDETTSSDTERLDDNSFEPEDYAPLMMTIRETPPSGAKLPDGNSVNREECITETSTIHQSLPSDTEFPNFDVVEDCAFVAQAPSKQETPRVRVLDESQVLPSEASFATVVLNQPLESDITGDQRAEVPDNPDAFSPHDRMRLFDDSRILSSEAGLGTEHYSDEVIHCDSAGVIHRAYSPLAEFLVRTNMNFRQLVTATALLISFLLVATLAIREFTAGQDDLTSHETVNTPVVFVPDKQSSTPRDRVTNYHQEPARIVPEQKLGQATERTSNTSQLGGKEIRGKNTQEKAVGPKATSKSEHAARAHRVDRRKSKNDIAVRSQTTAISSGTTAQRTGVSETSINNGSQRPRTVKGYRQKGQE